MPISYEVDTHRRIVRLLYERDPNFRDWASAMDDATRAPGYEPGFGFLFDRRSVPPATSEHIRAAVAWIGQHRAQVAGSRWAVVVTDPASYGMTRMGQALAEGLPVQLRVFKDVDEAVFWLLQPRADGGGPP
jgi:hypothetical protein